MVDPHSTDSTLRLLQGGWRTILWANCGRKTSCREGRPVNELVVIVEGETEQTFVRDQLAAHLALHNTSAWPILPGRRRNHGGVKKWEVARQDILRTLKEGRY